MGRLDLFCFSHSIKCLYFTLISSDLPPPTFLLIDCCRITHFFYSASGYLLVVRCTLFLSSPSLFSFRPTLHTRKGYDLDIIYSLNVPWYLFELVRDTYSGFSGSTFTLPGDINLSSISSSLPHCPSPGREMKLCQSFHI